MPQIDTHLKGGCFSCLGILSSSVSLSFSPPDSSHLLLFLDILKRKNGPPKGVIGYLDSRRALEGFKKAQFVHEILGKASDDSLLLEDFFGPWWKAWFQVQIRSKSGPNQVRAEGFSWVGAGGVGPGGRVPVAPRKVSSIRADFGEGDEDSNFSVFRAPQFTEWPGLRDWIAFPVEILTKLLIHWMPSPLCTENPFFFHWKA